MLAVVLAAAVTAAVACSSPRSSVPAPNPAGPPIPAATAAPLPPLEYRLISGHPWTSQDALGRVLVFDVWASFCPPA